MRLMILCGLLAVVSPLSPCERRNIAVCANETGYECEDGQFCQVETGQTFGKCVQAECGPSLPACPSERSLCQSGHCKACEGDAECQAQNAATPVCVAGACLACRDSSQCKEASRKVCDATTHTCRGCQLHSECSPGICAKDDSFATLATPIVAGTCVGTQMIAEVDTSCGGSCTLQSMLSSGVSPSKPYIRITRYTTMSKVTVPALPSGLPRYYVIGPLADTSITQVTSAPQINLSAPAAAAIEVTGGAHITLEGVVLSNSIMGLDCNSKSSVPAGVPTSVAILRSIISGNQTAIRAAARCELDVQQSWIGKGPSAAFAGLTRNDASLLLDSTRLRLVNSVLWDNGKAPSVYGGIKLTDSAALEPSIHIVNSTFAKLEFPSSQMALAVDCDYDTKGSLAIVNSLLLNDTYVPGYTYVSSMCRPAGSLAAVGTNEPGLSGGTNLASLAASTTFVDSQTGDLHLQSTAAAAGNGGVATFTDGKGVAVVLPNGDFEGKPRGTSTRSIGAFEISR